MAERDAESRAARQIEIRPALSPEQQADTQIQKVLDLFHTEVELVIPNLTIGTLIDPEDGRSWTINPYHGEGGDLSTLHMLANDTDHPEQFMLASRPQTGDARDYSTADHSESGRIDLGVSDPKAKLENAQQAERRLRSLLVPMMAARQTREAMASQS